jgi:hypothetical protein
MRFMKLAALPLLSIMLDHNLSQVLAKSSVAPVNESRNSDPISLALEASDSNLTWTVSSLDMSASNFRSAHMNHDIDGGGESYEVFQKNYPLW